MVVTREDFLLKFAALGQARKLAWPNLRSFSKNTSLVTTMTSKTNHHYSTANKCLLLPPWNFTQSFNIIGARSQLGTSLGSKGPITMAWSRPRCPFDSGKHLCQPWTKSPLHLPSVTSHWMRTATPSYLAVPFWEGVGHWRSMSKDWTFLCSVFDLQILIFY